MNLSEVLQSLKKPGNLIIGFLFLTNCLLILPNNIGSGARDISLALLFLAVLSLRSLPWKKWFTDPVVLCFLALLGCKVFITFFQDINRSLYMLRKVPGRAVLTLFVIWGLVHSKHQFDRWLVTIAIPLTYVWALIGGYVPHIFWPEAKIRPNFQSFEVYYNSTARYLNLYIPIIFSFSITAHHTQKQLAWGSLGLFGIIGVFLTRSRGGIISLAVMLVLFLIFFIMKFNLYRYYKQASVLLIILLLGVTLGFISGGFGGLERLENKGLDLSGRDTTIWPAAWELIKQRPLTGYPAGSFGDFVVDKTGTSYAHAHNVFIQQLFEGGVFGLLLYGLLVILLLYWGYGHFRNKHTENLNGAAVVCSVMGVMIAHGLVANISLYWIGMFIGFCYILLNRSVNHNHGTSCDPWLWSKIFRE